MLVVGDPYLVIGDPGDTQNSTLISLKPDPLHMRAAPKLLSITKYFISIMCLRNSDLRDVTVVSLS